MKNKLNYYNCLSMFFLTIMLGTYVLAYKMIDIFGITISAGIFIFPITYAIIDVITEVYGFDYTKSLIKNSFICCLFFSLVVPFLSYLSGPTGWPYQDYYRYILGNVLRFFIANTIGIVVGILVNAYLISKWKIILKGKYFWVRSIGSSAIGELITSIVADILAFFGTTDFITLTKMICGIFLIKLIYAFILAWPNSLLVLHLKLTENDTISENPNLNPFKNRELHAVANDST